MRCCCLSLMITKSIKITSKHSKNMAAKKAKPKNTKTAKKTKKTPKFKVKETGTLGKLKSKKENPGQEEFGLSEKEELLEGSSSTEEDELLEDLESDLGRCARCEKPLPEDPVQLELGGEVYKFCSEECADKFEPDVE